MKVLLKPFDFDVSRMRRRFMALVAAVLILFPAFLSHIPHRLVRGGRQDAFCLFRMAILGSRAYRA
jgi:hypothetical protein